MPDGCQNPRCSRIVKLHAEDATTFTWTGEREVDVCVPCYLALREGSIRPEQLSYDVLGPLSAADREAVA